MIRKKIAEIISDACESCKKQAILPEDITINPLVEVPREEGFGDYSTNIAFLLAPVLKKSPAEIARIFIQHITTENICERVEIAGKGFINFYLKDDVWRMLLKKISSDGIETLYPDVGNGKKVLIEFVSANPTGPLHIGHGRGAAVGDVLANILGKTGHTILKEYYINDAGRQIKTLGESTYLRWKELQGEEITYPKECYQGDYIKDLAQQLLDSKVEVPAEEEKAISMMARFSGDEILKGIKEDLEDFGVIFNSFYNESTLFDKGVVDDTLNLLKKKGYAYEKDGALWFTTSKFEKDEDRVLDKIRRRKNLFYFRYCLSPGQIQQVL